MTNRMDQTLSSPRGLYGLLGALVVLHFIIRGLLYPAAPSDDAEQMLFSQVFRWGYDTVNPPLYTWLVIAVQQVVGVENVSVSLVKFPAYGLIFYFLYGLARRTLADPRLAVLAALSPLLLYYVAWDAVLSYSHTVLATALIMAALAALLRLCGKGGALSYALFGLVVGLGGLSKYTFVLAALAMILAGLVYRPYRGHILHPYMLMALAVAGIVVAPHVYWLVQHSDVIGGAVSKKFEMGGVDSGFFETRLKGLASALTSGLAFLSPLWLVLVFVFWRPVRHRLKNPAPLPPAAKFLALYILLVVILLVAFVLLSGITKIRAHYMFVLLPFPLVFFAWVAPSLGQGRSIKNYGRLLVALPVLLVGGMVVKYVSEPLRCKRCQLLLPYGDIGQEIRRAGFTGGTIFAYYFPHDVAGNLRRVFPHDRIVSTKFPAITRPLSRKQGQCLLIWMAKPGGVMDATGMVQMANKFLETGIPLKDLYAKSLEFEFDRTKGRRDSLNYLLFDPGRGMCR